MRLPLGESDFKRVIEGKFDYVDKSLFIKELLDDDQVILITRPRRFGKTLNLSMLRYFFELEINLSQITTAWQRFRKNIISALYSCFGFPPSKNPNRLLFKQLAISKTGNAYLKHQGRYPVISLSLKDVKESSFISAYDSICAVIKDLYGKHDYLLQSDALKALEKTIYQSILEQNATEINVKNALKDLINYLHRHFNTEIVVLIDEYDTPIQQGYLHGYYDEIINFFRGFLGAGLKDNAYVFKAVLTGILRVAQENLFSGLNNLVVYSMLNPNYGNCFGFTEEEVENLLKAANLQNELEAVKHWYNGYRAGGNITIYNPWSIASYLKSRDLKPYWVNTSDNALIQNLLADSNGTFKQEFEILISGGSIRHVINEHFAFSDLKKNNAASLWNLMYMSGYLRVDSCEDTERGPKCTLSIPNLEISRVYRSITENWLSGNQRFAWEEDFLVHLLTGNIDLFKKRLSEIMEQIVSFHDTSRDPEAFYHGLVIGLTASLHRNENYELRSNRESGNGRYDYFILSRDPNKLSILMEFKRIDTNKLNEAAKTALQQIDLKNYFVEAEQRNVKKLLKIGIAFSGKAFALESRLAHDPL